MSRANVEVVRELIDAYLRGDYATAAGYLAPDVVYETGQEVPAHGPEAVKAMWERWESDWEELETTPSEFIDAGDQVLVAIHYSRRGRASGIELEDSFFAVYTLRDGKCVRKVEFRDRSDAMRAAGLRE